MTNITQIDKGIVALVLCLTFSACGRSDAPHLTSPDSRSPQAIEASTVSPADDLENRVVVGSLLIVKRDPPISDGRNVFIVLLNGYAGQKNLLFNLCTKNNFDENQNDIFLIGKIKKDALCQGYVIADDNFLKRDGSCRTKMNLDEVYLAKKGGDISRLCADLSIRGHKVETVGSCSIDENYEAFDTLGLVRCSKIL